MQAELIVDLLIAVFLHQLHHEAVTMCVQNGSIPSANTQCAQLLSVVDLQKWTHFPSVAHLFHPSSWLYLSEVGSFWFAAHEQKTSLLQTTASDRLSPDQDIVVKMQFHLLLNGGNSCGRSNRVSFHLVIRLHSLDGYLN